MGPLRELSGSSRRQVVVLTVGVFVLQLLFITSYVGGLGKPSPKALPVGVVGPAPVVELIRTEVAKKTDAFDFRAYPNEKAARTAIDHRKIYGAIVFAAEGPNEDLVIISEAPSPFTGQAIRKGVAAIDATTKRTAKFEIVHPLPEGDSEGLSLFYLVVGWVVGGYLLGTVLGLARGTAPGFRQVFWRLGVYAGYAVLSGMGGAWLMHGTLDLSPGRWFSLALVGALLSFAASSATGAFQSLIGDIGTALAILLFVVLGNPSSGGPFTQEFLGGIWRWVGPWLPPGAGVEAGRSVTYFDGYGAAPHVWVLVGWSVFGVAVAAALAMRRDPHGETPVPA
ncbi:MAG: hypothetical protein KDB02_06960 [Acidimicrobiales bacterium]|nr:hypothetical protein [Acidimicrobiales bacterium]